MTPAEFNRKMEARLRKLIQENAPLYLGVSTANRDRNVRIFTEGLTSSGSPIGQYSTKTMLATKSQFAIESKFKPTLIKSKKGKSHPLFIKFPKASKAVPVMVIPGGYKEFRSLNGRQNSKVDLVFIGNLRRDTVKIIRRNQSEYNTGPFNKENQDKLTGLQQKYGQNIATHTPAERAKLLDIVLKETVKILTADA